MYVFNYIFVPRSDEKPFEREWIFLQGMYVHSKKGGDYRAPLVLALKRKKKIKKEDREESLSRDSPIVYEKEGLVTFDSAP